MSKINLLVAIVLLGVTLAACQKKEGPGEKAGKEIDKAAKDVGESVEKAVDSVKDATESK